MTSFRKRVGLPIYALLIAITSPVSAEPRLQSYPVHLSQSTVRIVDWRSIWEVDLVEQNPKRPLTESLVWCLKQEVLHPNAGGRLSAVYVVGRFTDESKAEFELYGWWIRGPFLIESIDSHTGTSKMEVCSRLLPEHFQFPASDPDSEINQRYRNRLKINYHEGSGISWLGATPELVTLLNKTAEQTGGANSEER